ncbi:hypothetical protein AGDE_13268 [Angomonas deanei]|nr:hypothetical protein AGDE_13268 [Angomonas deanei]|eukprot:EPY22496.1 hypothetical protein AGDE_13268 [Angomonas deanei]
MLFYLFDEAEPTNREDIPAEYEERLRDIGTRQATRRALRLERFVESQRLQVQHSKKDVPLLLDAHTETEAATCQEKVDVAAAQVDV